MGPWILEPPEEGFQILKCHERRWCSDFLDDWWSDLATSTVERSRMVATEFSTERSGQLGAPPGRGRSELAGFRVHFRFAARSRPLDAAGQSGLVTIGLKALYFEFFSRPLGRLRRIRRIAALKRKALRPCRMQYPSGNADCGRPCRDILDNKRTRGNNRAVAYSDRTEDTRLTTYKYVVAYISPTDFSSCSDRAYMIQRTICTYSCSFYHSYLGAVRD